MLNSWTSQFLESSKTCKTLIILLTNPKPSNHSIRQEFSHHSLKMEDQFLLKAQQYPNWIEVTLQQLKGQTIPLATLLAEHTLSKTKVLTIILLTNQRLILTSMSTLRECMILSKIKVFHNQWEKTTTKQQVERSERWIFKTLTFAELIVLSELRETPWTLLFWQPPLFKVKIIDSDNQTTTQIQHCYNTL